MTSRSLGSTPARRLSLLLLLLTGICCARLLLLRGPRRLRLLRALLLISGVARLLLLLSGVCCVRLPLMLLLCIIFFLDLIFHVVPTFDVLHPSV